MPFAEPNETNFQERRIAQSTTTQIHLFIFVIVLGAALTLALGELHRAKSELEATRTDLDATVKQVKKSVSELNEMRKTVNEEMKKTIETGTSLLNEIETANEALVELVPDNLAKEIIKSGKHLDGIKRKTSTIKKEILEVAKIKPLHEVTQKISILSAQLGGEAGQNQSLAGRINSLAQTTADLEKRIKEIESPGGVLLKEMNKLSQNVASVRDIVGVSDKQGTKKVIVPITEQLQALTNKLSEIDKRLVSLVNERRKDSEKIPLEEQDEVSAVKTGTNADQE